MRARWLLLPLVLLVAACDSGSDTPDTTLDAAFYVGTWRLTTVRDDSGNRSADVDAVVETFDVDFMADGSFRLDVDFTEPVNTGGVPDRTVEGTFQARPEVPSLVLVSGGLAPSFAATSTSASSVSLSANELIVEQLLGGVGLDFTGTVTVTLVRQ